VITSKIDVAGVVKGGSKVLSVWMRVTTEEKVRADSRATGAVIFARRLIGSGDDLRRIRQR